jgi:choline kinase
MGNSFKASEWRTYILGAGRGSRLKDLSKETPKPLVHFQGKSLLQWNLEAFDSVGLRDIQIITGYKKEAFQKYHQKQIFNEFWATRNMLFSIIKAFENGLEAKKNILIYYGDILVSKRSIERIALNLTHTFLPFNSRWKPLWEARFENVLEDIESFKLNQDKTLKSIGKNVTHLEDVEGQFMGILAISCKDLPQWNEELKKYLKKDEHQNHSTTDFLDFIVKESGVKIPCHEIPGGWLEFDNKSDIEKYEDLIKEKNLFPISSWP